MHYPTHSNLNIAYWSVNSKYINQNTLQTNKSVNIVSICASFPPLSSSLIRSIKKYVLHMILNNDTFRSIHELQKSAGLEGVFVRYQQLFWLIFVIELLGELNRLQIIKDMYFYSYISANDQDIKVNKVYIERS